MKVNIFAPPQSELTETTDTKNVIASRWKRLWASLIDALSIMIVTTPVMFFTGGFDGISEGVNPPIVYSLLIEALGVIIFFLINANSLRKSGQTLGKKALGIKIVDLNGETPTFKKHLI